MKHNILQCVEYRAQYGLLNWIIEHFKENESAMCLLLNSNTHYVVKSTL